MSELIVFTLFAVAIFYVGNIVYKNFKTDKSCGGGCAKCSAIDVDEILNKAAEKIKN